MPNLVPQTINEWMRRMELRIEDVSNRVSNLVPRNIADNVDLDDFLFSGRYYRESGTGTTTGLGYPQDGAFGTLEVSRNPGVTAAQQIFHDCATGITWMRCWDGMAWGAWMVHGSDTGGFWVAFTPTLTNVTLGNGTLVARYTQVGKTVRFHVNITFGSTTNVTGTIDVGLPPPAAASQTGFVYPMGTAIARAGGATGSNVFKGFVTNTGTGVVTAARVVSANGGAGGAWNATTPITWATGALYSIMAVYEAS